MRTWLIYLFFCFCCIKVAGQGLVDTPTNHLRLKIQHSHPDTSRIKFLLALSKQLILKSNADKSDIKESYALQKQAEQISLKARDLKSLGRSKLMAALIENKKGNADNGLRLAQLALAYFKQINDLEDQGEALIIIGQHWHPTDKDIHIIIKYYQEAIQLFKKANEEERLATTLVDVAELQQNNFNLIEAYKNLHDALKTYKSIGFIRLTNVYNLLGQNLLAQGDKEDALKYTLLAERSAINLKDSSLQLSTVYNRIADCYSALQKYDKAIPYSKKALAVATKFRDTGYIFTVTFSLAKIYTATHQFKTSIHYLDKIKNWFTPGTASVSIIFYNLYVRNCVDLKDFKLAKALLNYLPLKNDYQAELKSYIAEAHIYYLQGIKRYNTSYPLLNLNRQFAINARLPKLTIRNELNWFRTDSALGNFRSALHHYQRSRVMSDSLFSLAKDKQVAIIQIDYETEHKEQQLAQQEKNIAKLKNVAIIEKQRHQARISLLIGISTLSLIVLVFGYSRYRLKQRNTLLLEAKQEEIRESNVLLQSIILEKEWLLKEVHHRVKNNLQIVMSLLNSQSAYLENSVAIDAIRESQHRVQAISLIHQKLYQGSDVASINMPAYVQDLLEYLADSFDTGKRHITF